MLCPEFKYLYLLLLIPAILSLGCENESSSNTVSENLPARIDTLQNLTVFPPNQPHDTVELVKEQVFESNEDVIIKGHTSDVVVDYKDRVYIEGFVPGEAGIYVFEPDGSYITTIGRHGRGPGEFLTMAGITLGDNQLHIYDSHQQKLAGFSIENFERTYERIIQRDSVKFDSVLDRMRPYGDMYYRRNGTVLMKFQSNMASNEYRDIRYYRISKEGQVLPERILELTRYILYEPENNRNSDGYIRIPRTVSFIRNALIAVSDEGAIYTAWTEDFLIKVYDENGTYQRAIYYPYEKSELEINKNEFSENDIELIEENSSKVPDSWPVLHTMEIDDENRLWVSTITNSDSTFQWWVLNQAGELLARFEWKGQRANRSVIVSPMYIIGNGFFYTRERNLWEGIDRIVKYRIVSDTLKWY